MHMLYTAKHYEVFGKSKFAFLIVYILSGISSSPKAGVLELTAAIITFLSYSNSNGCDFTR